MPLLVTLHDIDLHLYLKRNPPRAFSWKFCLTLQSSYFSERFKVNAWYKATRHPKKKCHKREYISVMYMDLSKASDTKRRPSFSKTKSLWFLNKCFKFVIDLFEK